MRILKIILALLICATSVFWASCTLFKSGTTAETKLQLGTVQRGDLTVDITASGNLAFSQVEKPAFQLTGVAGAGGGASFVAEVLVEVGDSVKKGQLIATLDTTQWDQHLKDLEDKLTSAKRVVTAKERALADAQLSLQTAEYNINTISDVQKAYNKLDDAKTELKIAEAKYKEVSGITGQAGDVLVFQANYWRDAIEGIKKYVIKPAQDELDDVLSGHSTTLSSNIAARDLDTQVQLKKFQLELAQARLEDAYIAIDAARRAQAEAQKNLDTDKAVATSVLSPIDGVVTQVNVAGGDQVSKGKVAAWIVDPNKFEAVVLVSEQDIFSLTVGKQATVQINAQPDVSFPAKITFIAPTATPQQGVVNFQVKVEVDTTKPVTQSQSSGQSQRARPTTGGGTGQAATGGGSGQARTGGGIGQAPSGGGTGQAATSTAPQSIQLREGLTITVSIPVAERKGVLRVPNRAIVRQGGVTSVQVVQDGVTSSRPIKTGLSDWQYTEVTDGLSEGEQVILQQVTAPTSTRTPSIGGMGGLGGIGR